MNKTKVTLLAELAMSGTEVFIAGFPRSGTTWLNRLLCEMLNAGQQNLLGEPLALEYIDTPDSTYVVRKTHWYRAEYSGVGYFGRPTKVVWISRDPRDMVASMMHYRHAPTIGPVIDTIETPEWPERGFAKYIDGWLEEPPDYHVTYEDLHNNPLNCLSGMYEAITERVISLERVEEIVEKHRFDKWVERFPHAMHKGVIGDWKNHFTYDDALVMEWKYGRILRTLGYTTDPNWVDEVDDNG